MKEETESALQRNIYADTAPFVFSLQEKTSKNGSPAERTDLEKLNHYAPQAPTIFIVLPLPRISLTFCSLFLASDISLHHSGHL